MGEIKECTDRDEWNRVALTGRNGTVFHTWEWSTVIEKGFQIKTLRLGHHTDGKLDGIMPVFLEPYDNRILKGYVAWSPHPGAWGYGGPCILPDKPEGIFTDFINYVRSIAKKERIIDLRISSFEEDLAPLREALKNEKWWTETERYTGTIGLETEPEKILEAMKKEHRKAIRQAINFGVTIEEAKSIDEINMFYDLFEKEITERKRFRLNPKEYFLAFWELVKSGLGQVYYARCEGRIIGFQMVTTYRGTAIAEHNSSPKELLRYRQNNLFKWHLINEYHKKGYKTLDLGGLPKDKESGIYLFKTGFSPVVRYTPEIRIACRHKWRVLRKKL